MTFSKCIRDRVINRICIEVPTQYARYNAAVLLKLVSKAHKTNIQYNKAVVLDVFFVLFLL